MLRRLVSKHPGHVDSVMPIGVEDFWPIGDDSKFDVVVALYGSGSFLGNESVRRIINMVKPGGKWMFMCYGSQAKRSTWDKWGITESVLITGWEALNRSMDPTRAVGHHEIYRGYKGPDGPTLKP